MIFSTFESNSDLLLDPCQTQLPEMYGGHCYGLFNYTLTYQQAEDHCRQLGAHLVWIEDQEEQAFLESTFPM